MWNLALRWLERWSFEKCGIHRNGSPAVTSQIWSPSPLYCSHISCAAALQDTTCVYHLIVFRCYSYSLGWGGMRRWKTVTEKMKQGNGSSPKGPVGFMHYFLKPCHSFLFDSGRDPLQGCPNQLVNLNCCERVCRCVDVCLFVAMCVIGWEWSNYWSFIIKWQWTQKEDWCNVKMDLIHAPSHCWKSGWPLPQKKLPSPARIFWNSQNWKKLLKVNKLVLGLLCCP